MEKTNLNVSPYYDDFAENKDFHRVLFRPGFAVQARELTQLQTILQNQIERHGRHFFKEGTVVIPGSIGFTDEYYAVKLSSTISQTDISSQIQDYVGKRITGSTSGVVAEVIQAVAATTDDPITLYVKYVATGDDVTSTVFTDGELISADGIVGSFGADVESAQLEASDATATGSSANIEEGVYFIRGHFVRVAEQRIILDKYSNKPSYRVGLSITETLETPEEDGSLLDNAQGSSNVNAKGAHRLKFSLTLDKLSLTSTDDENFVELMRIQNGNLEVKARNTEYSVLGETLARRTFDESGDYTVRDFQLDIRENLNDGLNNGIYTSGQTTDSGNTASDDFLTIQVAPGKAYVRGYEIETIAPKYIDVPKPRTVETYAGSVTPVEVGNFATVDNLFGGPEISPEDAGEIDQPYREVELRDAATSARGSGAGNVIGLARVRGIEHFEGNTGTSTDILSSTSLTNTKFKLYLFDIRMFTKITLSGTPSAGVDTGAKITGVNSGAYGYVASATSGATVVLTSVVGTFIDGEKVTSTSSTEADEILEDSGNTDLTIATNGVTAHDFSEVKQTFMLDPDGSPDANFSADIFLDSDVTISGLVTNSTTTLNGFQTSFETELQDGDVISLPSGAAGASEEFTVTVTNNTTLTLSGTPTNTVTSVNAIRKRAKLKDQQKNILLRKLQKNGIKTLKTEDAAGASRTTVVVRETFHGSTSSGAVSFGPAGTNETFNAVDNEDFVLIVVTGGTGTAATGDIINLNSSNVTVTGQGTNTLVVTSPTVLGNGADVRLVATLTRTVTSEKNKTRNRVQLLQVDNDGIAGGGQYGTSAHHKDISFGVADVHKLHAIYTEEDNTKFPYPPSSDISSSSGTFTAGELITGGTSGAIARLITVTTPISYVNVNGRDFAVGETITGGESTATATIDANYAGSRDVTNQFTLDNGQRDNYYDIAKLVRKSSAIAPVGKLLIVYDNFDHGGGDFFTVDSYSSIDYKDIPVYTATRVDPEVAEPTGEYDLRDAVDFRPRVADKNGTGTNITDSNTVDGPSGLNLTCKKVTDFTFNFEDRLFTGTGASTTNLPKDNSNFQYDFEYYVGRIDSMFLTPTGDFKVISGAPSENPLPPKPLDDAMHIAKINLNPYVLSTNDVDFTKTNNRRYTMKDIGKLENRINNMEYYTALSLLEKEAQSLEIQDSNGLNRFKSGILVDNFRGHSTGDVNHPDYRAAVDMQAGELRPKYYMKGIGVSEEAANDSDRTLRSYQKTGDIVTLPYDHTITASQPYATRVENLNPVLNFAWAGVCVLNPSGDEWFEVNQLPDIIINREGNFDSVLAANRNALGTVWGSWQSQWGGTVTERTTTFRETSWARARSRVPFRPIIRRTILSSSDGGPLVRQGVQTSVIPQIDVESQGNKVLSRALIPFMRSKNVHFKATGMKPLTRVYPFFDKTPVSQYCVPAGGAVTGTRSNLAVTTTGSWTSISKVEFEYFKKGGDPLIATISSRPDSGEELVTIDTDTYPGATTSNVTETGLNLLPNNKGEHYIRLYATDTNNAIGANDRLYDIKVYDQSGNLIPRSKYQIVKNTRWSNIGRAFDSSSSTYAEFQHERYPRADKVNAIEFKVVDGAKTVVPTSGNLSLIDNTAIDETALVTSPAGTVEGIFTIPDPNVRGNPKFRTGDRLFRLSSSSTNEETPQPETFAQAIFSSTGILTTMQETFIHTRNARVEVRNLQQRTNGINRDDIVGWWDPLAQSFMPQADGGEVLTKVDAFFSQKDAELPVTCQIREMQNGYPTTTVLPFASVTLEPDEVSVSEDASVATTFEFEHPVYVKNGVEYCIVLQTDSDKYLAWISRMGELDVGGSRLVSEQPYLGVLFKSQNNTTWTAYDFEDLKFNLYRAKFDTSKTGVLTLVNDELPVKTLEDNPVRTFASSNVVKITHRDHHMYEALANNVTIAGVSSGYTTTLNGAILAGATSITLTNTTTWPSWATTNGNTIFLKIGDEIKSGVVGSAATSIGTVTSVEGTDSDHADGTTVELYMIHEIPLTEINKTHTSISNVGIDSYTITTTTNAATNGDGTSGGNSVTATENAMADVIQPFLPIVEFPDTQLTAKVRSTSATSADGGQSSFDKQTESNARVIATDDEYYFDNPIMVASQINETNEMSGTKSMHLIYTMTSDKDNLSPMIDLDRKTVAMIANRLDNVDSASDVYPTTDYVPPTDPEGDNNEVIYCTRKVTLKTPATAIKVYLDAVQFDSSEIQVMYKILRSDDASDFDEIGWQYFNTNGSPDENVNASVDYQDFIERQYTADGLQEFISFAIKIRMQGTNSSEPPRCKDLRAIAMAT